MGTNGHFQKDFKAFSVALTRSHEIILSCNFFEIRPNGRYLVISSNVNYNG